MKVSDELAGQILYEIEMAKRTSTGKPLIPWEQAFIYEQQRCITVAKEFRANITAAEQVRTEKEDKPTEPGDVA